jgi:hypothetical protein
VSSDVTEAPTVAVQFVPSVGGGYAVHLDGAVLGYVARCPLNPAVWNAYTGPNGRGLIAQRSTRQKAAALLAALVRATCLRPPEIPEAAVDALGRALRMDWPLIGTKRDDVRAAVAAVAPVLIAHDRRCLAYDLHDSEDHHEVSDWLNKRADEIDGGADDD